jgi:hypothetical protein
MKQNKKLKFTLSFASPKKKIIILYLRCDCEAKKRKKSPVNTTHLRPFQARQRA